MSKDVNEIIDLLSAHNHLPEAARDELISQAKVLSVMPEQELQAANQVPQYIYFVAKGLLRAVFTMEDGKEFSKEFYWYQDAILSLAYQISGEPMSYSIQACEASTVYAFPMALYKKLVAGNEQWKQYHQTFLERHILFKEEKEQLLLVNSNEDRVRMVYKQFPKFVKRVPAVMLATYIGITPESLSRIKKRLCL